MNLETLQHRELLTCQEAAVIAGVSRHVVAEWIDRHGLPTVRMPGLNRRRIRRAALLQFMEAEELRQQDDDYEPPQPEDPVLAGVRRRMNRRATP